MVVHSQFLLYQTDRENSTQAGSTEFSHRCSFSISTSYSLAVISFSNSSSR
ncbi:unnamed protein product [Periconia digitata]|uniref:Uncharacterized protein n=1 Tax=Periconia digitata TaxID=1303443 RepID=A0A9W4UHE3_9PLEO|nr:unnamed protein product [Periconia digitata]